jgi:Ras-related protein Rab-28
MDMHTKFATENDMSSFYVSAKTGDQVSSCFYHIAADLAGVALSRPEIEVATKVVTAEIVNHPRHDPDVVVPPRKEGRCSVM